MNSSAVQSDLIYVGTLSISHPDHFFYLPVSPDYRSTVAASRSHATRTLPLVHISHNHSLRGPFLAASQASQIAGPNMSSIRHVARSTTPASIARTPSLAVHSYGRAPAYRRLISSTPTSARTDTLLSASCRVSTAPLTLLRSPFLPESVAAIQLRGFRGSPQWFQDPPAQSDKAPKPEKKSEPEQKPEPEQKSEQTASSSESEAKSESEEQKKQQDGEESGEGKKDEKKEDLPPPPPHGDKTPWQVFMETMQTEFKASKEWNESTKQLSDSAHQFTESESVRRARQAYESTTGAVSSTAGKVLKTSLTPLGRVQLGPGIPTS